MKLIMRSRTSNEFLNLFPRKSTVNLSYSVMCWALVLWFCRKDCDSSSQFYNTLRCITFAWPDHQFPIIGNLLMFCDNGIVD